MKGLKGIILDLKTVCFLLIVAIGISCDSDNNTVLNAKAFSMSIDKSGNLTSLRDTRNNQEYLAKGLNSPLLTVVLTDSTKILPQRMITDIKEGIFTLYYEGEIKVDMAYSEKESYLKFEVVDGQNMDKVSGIIWGAYPTTINETIGELVGVVRDSEFAIGIQALNPQTTGGVPVTNAGFVPSRKGPAFKTDYGSALQAFAINRSLKRTANVWEGHYQDMPIPSIKGSTVIGSKIAIFGCSPEEVLATVGGLEIEEGLPHPTIDGEWVKTHPLRSKAYFITSFDEGNFDELLEYVKMAGMTSIYHSHPFENWGKFDLLPELFPNGNKGMKKLVEKAKDEGIRVGAHTLTTFITPNDPFITPVPHKDLAKTGYGELTANLNVETTEIPIGSKKYFEDEQFNWMHTVQIGDELIRYRSVSDIEPYKLLDCERGAFGTTISEHKKGAQVGKLLDHPYKVFFPNLELQKEMAQNLTDFLNETGVSHIDFDGHEGALAAGQGVYGMDDFALKVFEGTDFNLVNGSSRTTHFYWHINHYINWGEPWYGGFRESQSEHRFSTQPFLEANYLPNMLGWFSLTPETTLEDIEWMLAKGAGYNAGFALSANYKALKANPETNKILETIRDWEHARLSGSFTPEQRKDFRNVTKEFSLRNIGGNNWILGSSQHYNFEYTKVELQPGEPTYAKWKFKNEAAKQPLMFTISLQGEGAVSQLSLDVVNYVNLKISEVIKQGETISLDAEGNLIHYDSKGKVLKKKIINNPPILDLGEQSIQLDCMLESGSPKVELKLKLQGKEEKINMKQQK
ncbi:hypothetical protein H4O18_04850 [Arenibacter sp. BSSL-BM3]|uniref:Uncharacterized protein n=1 Tax=Arenibacter arenosicollis TaxID=2762274 RepID=A0ABR7QJG0_9FLAO|nr:hypothetical protein [Arenibacter arenosicollis]MBC8767313.1 hypothetical protein [Arenibacter arenosicollis]